MSFVDQAGDEFSANMANLLAKADALEDNFQPTKTDVRGGPWRQTVRILNDLQTRIGELEGRLADFSRRIADS